MHVPGLALIAKGIDGASRSGTDFVADANLDSVVGPSVSDELWSKIAFVAQSARLRVTLYLFASESNRARVGAHREGVQCACVSPSLEGLPRRILDHCGSWALRRDGGPAAVRLSAQL